MFFFECYVFMCNECYHIPSHPTHPKNMHLAMGSLTRPSAKTMPKNHSCKVRLFEYLKTLELPTPKTQKKTGWSSGWLVGRDDFSRFGKAEAMYNLGAGQWHPELRFSDPIFGSSETMVQGYLAEIYGRRYWNTVTVYWWYIYETIL